jgi:hypothetical protein
MNNIKPTLIGGIPNNLSETNKNIIVYVDQFGMVMIIKFIGK